MSTGAKLAQEVLRLRSADAERAAARQREERVLATECVPFFEAITSLLRENVTTFNLELSLVGKDALTFVSSAGLIEIGKKSNPFLLRRAVHLQANQEVVVRTETSIHYRIGTKQERWRFTVEHEELLLNGKNVIECADALFEGVADAFR
jgi:hypothetical protein